MLTINQELQHGQYRITKQFGQGKTVSFYEAYDRKLEKHILLKKILVKLEKETTSAQQEAQKNAFDSEAKFLTEIKHDGFLQVFDYFSDTDSQYLVMESVDGKNIGDIIKKGENLVALADIVDWGEQMLDALDYLHKKTPPVIYFNVKPPNVHLTSRGKIKLLATGIAARNNGAANITKQAFDAESLNYSPLELIWEKLDSASQRAILNGYDEKSQQILMQPPDVRSDIYSLGATLYHLLTGKIPIDALERSIAVLEGKLDPLLAPNEVDANISAEISEVLMKALKLRRENRFESALEMGQELEKAYFQLKERRTRELRNEVPATPGVAFVKPKPTLQSVKPKPTLPEVQNVSQETPQIKSEESEQLELMRQKLCEAEAQRLAAEKRAAKAEKLLLEKENQFANEIEDSEIIEFPENSVQLSETPKVANEISEEDIWQEAFDEDSNSKEILFEEVIADAPQKHSSDEFENLFAQPQKNNKFMKRIAAVALGIIVLGGGVLGVLRFLPSASAEQNQATANQTVSVPEPNAEPQPRVETVPTTEPETTPEMSEAQTSGTTLETKQNFTETPLEVAPFKEKPAVPQIATAKTPSPPKPAVTENDKKKVTVDDLINDTPKKKVTVDDLINDN
jgi:serine/threonine protein kinase/PBP1b-binding outer membrane lipoprotein LpoB